jgi:hypothetical protein
MPLSQLVAIIQLVTIMLCTAVAFGLLLSTIMVRGRLHAVGSEGPLHDIAFSEKVYVAAATFCAIGAVASIQVSWGTFALFLGVAASLHLADLKLLAPMRDAHIAGQPVPYTGTRARLELLAGSCLFFIFWKTAVPPLITLALIYGIV